jgi:DNA-directed RNA polymerase specialized sigma24 family protein
MDHSSAAPGHARFDATRWSVVLEAAQSRAAGGPEALARLCERYWPRLYAFARHRGHGPEDAQDLVQGFFQHLIESRALGAVDRAKGRFRSFMLASFQNFMAMERRRAGAEKRLQTLLERSGEAFSESGRTSEGDTDGNRRNRPGA